VGFKSVRNLRASRCAEVPKSPGVYLVLRDPARPPSFLETSSGGHFKDKNPTVSQAELRANWVDGALVIYIGKAGGGSSQNDLQNRLLAYIRFGAGARVGHWGGRFIWQLEDSDDLLVCWRPCHDVDAIDFETSLIQCFSRQYGKRPFANLRD
jgi:hypothetical protein